ncbi:MAG: TolC family protein [bacterium]
MKILAFIMLILGCTTVFAQTNNLTLEEVLNYAKQNNPDIKKAEASINSAKGRFWENISLPQPNVSASYEFIPKGKSLSGYDERTIEISQEFEFPTTYYFKGLNASTEIDIAKNSLQQVINQICFEVSSNYYDVLEKKEQCNLALENYNLSVEFKTKSTIRYKSGEASNIENLTAELQMIEAENTLGKTKTDYNNSLKELFILIGKSYSENTEDITIIDSLEYTPIIVSAEQLINFAVNNNPLIVDQKLNTQISSTNKSLAYSSILPTFSISYMKQANAESANFYGWNFGISVPIWFMFDQRGKIQQAYADCSLSEYELQKTINTTVAGINNTIANFETIKKQIETYKSKLLPYTKEIYQTALKSYQAGEISYMEFIMAKQTNIKIKEDYISLLKEYNVLISKLTLLTGTDIKFLEVSK